MIKIIILFVLSFICLGIFAKTIELTSKNHTALLGPVTTESITQVISDLNSLDSPELFIYIDSPGGDVFAGLILINYILTSDRKISCVANSAASMAHQILQVCHTRIGTEHNVLMQHKLATTVQGNPQDIAGQLGIMQSLEEYLDTMSSKRIGITLQEYQRRTAQPWYTFGRKSLEQNVIDKISLVKCSKELYNKHYTKDVNTFLGTIKLTYNGCPLLPPVRG